MPAEPLGLSVAVPASQRNYMLYCGCQAATLLPRLLDEAGATGRVIVCSDENVAALHGDTVLSLLRESGRAASTWTMPAGEVHKTLQTVDAAYRWLATQRVERGDTLLALGGGVVGDLAGFVAATYLRGLRLVQMPTTLVAQVDSALGGKVGVDLPAGKNLVGAFYQPAFVLADTDLLLTLPAREWTAGLAEVVKHGIIRDRELLAMLEQRRTALAARDPATVAAVVARAAAVKVAVVVADPYERDLRRILNYGHTLGHAIEREAGYGTVLHGEAVAWGMAAAARIGRAVGTCGDDFVRWQDALLRSYGLLGPLPPLRTAALMEATRLDKKSVAGRVSWVLPRAPGEVVISAAVSDAAVRQVVEELISAPSRGT